jgi:hypothetical protein
VKKAIVFATVMTVLVFASVALAGGGSSLLSGYDQQVAQGARISGAAAPPTKGTLPFTGFDLLPIVAGGLALVFAGVALRRSAHRKS